MLHNKNTPYEIYYHVNFSTRWLSPALNREKIEWIEQIIRKKGEKFNFNVMIVNGYREHVHMLLSIPPTLALDDVMKLIKIATARAIPGLAWQRGYYVKTVDGSSLERVYKYIKHRWVYRGQRNLN